LPVICSSPCTSSSLNQQPEAIDDDADDQLPLATAELIEWVKEERRKGRKEGWKA
jgi:hypothetical protein